MTTDNTNLTEFSMNCISSGDELEPSANELENFYQLLEGGNVPELQWTCPGRRSPSPIIKQQLKVENAEKETESKNDFDFIDDIVLPQIRVRAQNSTPKGSAKKKTANFAGVIETLKKQMLNSQSKSEN